MVDVQTLRMRIGQYKLGTPLCRFCLVVVSLVEPEVACKAGIVGIVEKLVEQRPVGIMVQAGSSAYPWHDYEVGSIEVVSPST